MTDIINIVVNVIKQAVISGFLVYIVLGSMLIIATLGILGSWRRVAGYLLGWLIAIFVIFVFTSSRTDVTPSTGALFSADNPINLLSLVLPGTAGIVIGFLLLLILTRFGDSEGGQAMIIAIVCGGSVIMLFFMSVSPSITRSLIGTFAIAFAIGALAHIVLKGVPSRATI